MSIDNARNALRPALAEVCRRLLQRGRTGPASLSTFYRELCRQLKDGSVSPARLSAALVSDRRPAAYELRRFAEACQLEAVSLALRFAGGSVATGRMAAAAGIDSYNTYCRIHRASTGRNPVFVHVPARPAFDALRWHQVLQGTLSRADAEALARRLADLYPAAFEAGPPDARDPGEVRTWAAPRPWRLAAVPQSELGAVLEQAAAPLLRVLDSETEGLPSPYGEAVRFLGRNLSRHGLGQKEIRRAARVGDTSLSTRVLFHTGDTLKERLEKLRLDMALRLLPDRRFSVEAIAEAVGVHVRTLRRTFEEWTGVRLTDVHATVKQTFGHPDFEAWLRAEDGCLADEEARRIGGDLLAVHPGAFSPAEPPHPRDDPPADFLPEIASFPDRLAEIAARQSPVVAPAAAPVEPESFSRPDTKVREDFVKLREVAKVLSSAGGNQKSARAVETLYATHESAPFLYRVREIQCFVTTDQLLEAGQIPMAEPWAECLRVMARTDPVSFEEWAGVVGRLTDAKRAVDLWSAADEKRRRLLELTGKARLRVLRKNASYLLARTCLFAAERYHRGQGLHGLMLEEDQAAVAMARVLCKRHFSRRSRSRPRRPSVLTDLEVLGLARIANDRRIGGNAGLAVAAIAEAHKAALQAPVGAYVRAEVASLEASVLTEQGLDLRNAEVRADEAIRAFSEFDDHMAALVSLKKAEILRLRSGTECISITRQAIDRLDGKRDCRAVEVAHNNLLFYLVEAGRQEDAQHWRRLLPVPTLPAYRASRATVEGCIELVWGSLEAAKALLVESVGQFIKLRMFGDAMIALLYLAAVHEREGDHAEVRNHLILAAQMAENGKYSFGAAIRGITDHAETVGDVFEQILRIASEAGGCLGAWPRHPRSH